MKHRHVNTSEINAVAVASIIERGDIEDWRELFAKINLSPALRTSVLALVKQSHDDDGYMLVKLLLES